MHILTSCAILVEDMASIALSLAVFLAWIGDMIPTERGMNALMFSYTMLAIAFLGLTCPYTDK